MRVGRGRGGGRARGLCEVCARAETETHGNQAKRTILIKEKQNTQLKTSFLFKIADTSRYVETSLICAHLRAMLKLSHPCTPSSY